MSDKTRVGICDCKPGSRGSYSQAVVGKNKIVTYDEDDRCLNCGYYVRMYWLTDEEIERFINNTQSKNCIYFKTLVVDKSRKGTGPQECSLYMPRVFGETIEIKRKDREGSGTPQE